MDRGQKDTEALIKEMEKRINAEYSKAEKEIEEQLTDYFRRYEIKDKKWQEWVADGKKTEAEYKAWRTQQLAVGQKWQDQKTMIAEEMAHSNEIARQIVNDTTPQIYGYNHDWATWQVEHDASVNTGYTLYNKDAVARMLKEDPDLLPPPSQKTLDRIAKNKDIVWNKQQLQSVMMQGILQGDSIPKLATRLSTTVGERNRKAAIRNARTMATGAQNAGRNNAYKRAEKKGIDLEKTWLATMDNRTRHSHRWIDRETVPMDEDFSNGLEYPADPKGDPAEVYNCRCSMRAEVKGLERRSGKFRDDSAVEHMSYDEWRNAKPKSRDILHQDKVSEAMKRKHIREYGGYGTGKAKEVTSIPPEDTTPKIKMETREDRIKKSGLLERDYAELDDMTYKGMVKDSLKSVKSEDKKQISKHKNADGSNGGYVGTTNYKEINTKVREGKIDQLNDDDKKTRDALNRATSSYSLPQDTNLYRYVHARYQITDVFGINADDGRPLGEWDINYGRKSVVQGIVDEINKQKGKIIEEKSVLSTSVIREKNVVSYDKSVRMIIEAPQGTNCYLPNNKRESECILGENTELYFKNAYIMPAPDGSGNIIEMVWTIVNEVK